MIKIISRGVPVLVKNATQLVGVSNENAIAFVKEYISCFLACEAGHDPVEFLGVKKIRVVIKDIDGKILVGVSINKGLFRKHISMNANAPHDMQLCVDAMNEYHCDFFRDAHENHPKTKGVNLFKKY